MSDLISRQEAIDAIQQHREDVLGYYEYDENVAFVYAAAHNHITEVIKRLPSAQPTIDAVPVRHGQWIITPYTDYDDTYECSVCGNTWTFIEGTPKDNDCNYCPHCGAKMEVKEA